MLLPKIRAAEVAVHFALVEIGKKGGCEQAKAGGLELAASRED